MKKGILLGLLAVMLPFGASADLSCPVGEKVESVLVSEGIPSVPAVTHIEIVVDAPAYDEYVFQGFHQGDYIKIGSNYFNVGHNNGFYDKVHHEAVTHEEIVIDTPEVPGTPAVYEDQCVTDPDYVPPSEEVTPTPEPETPAPAPAPKKEEAGPQGSSIFRKLCNLHTLFGVGICPEFDPIMGVVWQQYYVDLIARLKAGL